MRFLIQTCHFPYWTLAVWTLPRIIEGLRSLGADFWPHQHPSVLPWFHAWPVTAWQLLIIEGLRSLGADFWPHQHPSVLPWFHAWPVTAWQLLIIEGLRSLGADFWPHQHPSVLPWFHVQSFVVFLKTERRPYAQLGEKWAENREKGRLGEGQFFCRQAR